MAFDRRGIDKVCRLNHSYFCMDPVQSGPFSFKRLLTVLVSVVFLVVFWQWISSPMIITVSGTGEASVPATSATVSFSVTATDASAQGAITQVKGKADTARQMLKTNGISEEDIVESQLTVIPASLTVQGASGFQAQIIMGAKTVHVAKISNLISDLYAQGVMVVSQPVLSVDKVEELEAKAVDEAMKNAKKQAGKIALKNWKFLKKMVAYSQQSSSSTSTSTSKADTLMEANSQEAAQNGVFKIVKAVSVSYKMW